MSKSKLLAISIPTYNRAKYLEELLVCIKNNLEKSPFLQEYLNVYVFDNDSSDNTSEIVKNCEIDIIYKKNETNTKADPNINQAYTIPDEEYIWVIGDDELLSDFAINNVIKLIQEHSPALIIQSAKEEKDNEYQFFNSYNEFAQITSKKDPYSLIAHSLISANIIKKSFFDQNFAKEKLATCYGHMYGMINGICNKNSKIIKINNNDLIVRQQRAPYHDDFPSDIKNLQKNYLYWIKEKYNLEEIDIEKIFEKPKMSLFRKIIREINRIIDQIKSKVKKGE